MSKHRITEGVVEKFLVKLYNAFISGKSGHIKVKDDKELADLVAKAEKAHQELVTYFEQQRKKHPSAAKRADWVRNNL